MHTKLSKHAYFKALKIAILCTGYPSSLACSSIRYQMSVDTPGKETSETTALSMYPRMGGGGHK